MIIKRAHSGDCIAVDRSIIDADTSISFKAKGILTYLLGKPDRKRCDYKEIASHAKDGVASVKSGVMELRRAGYIQGREIPEIEDLFAESLPRLVQQLSE